MKVSCFFLSVLLIAVAFGVAPAAPAVNVRLVTDEAEAVLAILAKRKASQPITETDWQRVFQSEGYVRLKQRETSMQRSFEDADFKTFAVSDQLLARAAALAETLARWKRADVTRAGNLALAYLPKDATIRAKLIECMCDQRLLLATYNRAAAKFNRRANKPLALWSAPVVSPNQTVRNSWKGIVPLHSTRADVKRILGTARTDLKWSEYFDLPDALAVISYQIDPCKEGEGAFGFGWNVPKDTVTAIGVIPKGRVSLERLLVQGDFKPAPDNSGFVYYTDQANGVTIETYKNAISLLAYEPGEHDKALKCPVIQSCCLDVFPKFDAYGPIPFAQEKTRLDNWSIQIININARGLLVIYDKSPDGRRKLLQRAERAKNYLVRERGLAPQRLLIVDGGYKQESTIELRMYSIGGPFTRVFL